MAKAITQDEEIYTKRDLVERISMRWGGAAGDGLQSTGLLLLKFLNRHGYFVHGFPGTQSTIRGGHVWYSIEFSSIPFGHFDRSLDILIALTPNTLDIHLRDLKEKSCLIYNSDKFNLNNYSKELEEKKIAMLGIPISTLAKEIDPKTPILSNSIAIGVVIQLLGLDVAHYESTLKKRFKNREKVYEKNYAAVIMGSNYFKEKYEIKINCCEAEFKEPDSIVISGNEAIALGAAASGLKFLAQYPITPASSILTYLANRARKLGIVVRQVEDELAAINMCIGASFAGARAMTASSGPGLSLMAESIGYSGMTETPIVLVDAMRAGPSTGIPTKMEQADLLPLIYSSHGESPRAILAPRTVEECFEVTVRAFNIADRFQIPVIVLSDFSLSERVVNMKPFDLHNVEIDRGKIWKEPSKKHPEFKRYEFTEDGISPRAFPPTKGSQYILVGAEHDEESHSLSGNRCGYPLSWKIREKMFNKRFKKLEILREEMSPPEIYGPKDADFTILTWGSTKGAVKEAVIRLNQERIDKWNMLSFVDLYPLPYQKIKPFLDKIKKSIVYEVNYTGQFEDLIHHHLDWRPTYRIHPLSGETPTPTSVINEIKQLLNNSGEVI